MVTRVGLWGLPLLGPDTRWGSREELSDLITVTWNIVLPGGPGVTLH